MITAPVRDVGLTGNFICSTPYRRHVLPYLFCLPIAMRKVYVCLYLFLHTNFIICLVLSTWKLSLV